MNAPSVEAKTFSSCRISALARVVRRPPASRIAASARRSRSSRSASGTAKGSIPMAVRYAARAGAAWASRTSARFTSALARDLDRERADAIGLLEREHLRCREAPGALGDRADGEAELLSAGDGIHVAVAHGHLLLLAAHEAHVGVGRAAHPRGVERAHGEILREGHAATTGQA